MEFVLGKNAEHDGPIYFSVRANGQRKICPVKAGQRVSVADLGSAPHKVRLEGLQQVGTCAIPVDTPTGLIEVPTAGAPIEVKCVRQGGDGKAPVLLPSIYPDTHPDAIEAARFKPLDKTEAARVQRMYLEQINVGELFEEVVRELLLHRPTDARGFLRRHFAGMDAGDPFLYTAKLGDTAKSLNAMADKHLAGATELEKARALMQDEIDAKTQDALWWKTRCEQQFDAVGLVESTLQKASGADAARVAAEQARANAEAELSAYRAAKEMEVSGLLADKSRLEAQVEGQAAQLDLERREAQARLSAMQSYADESSSAARRRLAQVEFQLNASTAEGVQMRKRCKKLKEALREATGDQSLEMDSDSEGLSVASPLPKNVDEWHASQDSLRLSGDLTEPLDPLTPMK